MFVIKLNYVTSLEVINKLRPAHLQFLDKYYTQNIFIASGRRIPAVGGIIIAGGVSKERLEEILKEDPFHIEKAAEYEILEFTANKYINAIKDLI